MKNREQPTVRIGKLYSKLSGQKNLIQVEHYSPTKSTLKKHGSLFFIIEITQPQPDSKKVIDTIIDTTVKHFYQNLDDTLTSFEIALRHVNEKLAELAENGNSHWISHLNSLIVAIHQHDIHLAQTGSAEAFLIRNKIISHITEGLSEKSDDKHPLNTYLNISSGQMKISDRVILSTEQLYNNLSLDRIRRLSVQHSPSTCAAEIARILAQENIRSIGTMILEATTEERLAKEVIRPQPEDVILQDRTHSGTKFSETMQNIKTNASEVSLFFSGLIERVKGTFSPKKQNDTQRKPKTPPKSPQKPVKNSKRLPKNETTIRQQTSQNLLQKINRKAPNKQILIIVALVVFVAALAFSVTYLRNRQNINDKMNAVSEKIALAEDFINQADNALIIGDKSTAKSNFNQAQDALYEISTSPYHTEEIAALQSRIDSKLDEVDNIIRIDITNPLADLNSIDPEKNPQYSHLYKIDDNLYTFSDEIISINTKNGNMTGITGFDINNFVGGTLTNDDSTVTFYHNGQMQKFSPANNTLIDVSTLDTAWKPAVELASYYENLYLLSPIENQVYKYSTLGGNSYSAALAYIDNPDKLDLANAADLAIDGGIYILKKDGTVYYFEQGVQQNYKLASPPAPYENFSSPTHLYTDENLDYIFILDPENKRLVQFRKEKGEYVKQFVGDELKNIDSFVVNDKIKTIYILADNKIYSVNY